MWATVFAVILTAVTTPALGSIECPQLGINLVVREEPQQLFSPGYPDTYKSSLNCLWYFAVEKQSSDLAIQIVTLKMDLDDYNGACDSDYLEAITGTDENSGASIARWCGKEKRVVKYTGSHMVLKLHTDDQFTGEGFILSYSLVKLSTASCHADAPRPITIGKAPIYEVFKGAPSVQRCQWYISTSDRNTKLVVELFKPSETMGSKSLMTLYEGSEASGIVNFEWNPRETMFSKIYLSTFEASLVLSGVKDDDENDDGIILKFSAMDSFSYAADCIRQTPATLEFGEAPILFSMPFTTGRRSGKPCALTLRNTNDMDIRLDAVAVKDAVLTCENEPITAQGPNSSLVPKDCNRGQTPVYFLDDSWMTISLPYQRTMYLMASPMDKRCNGFVQEVTAYRDIILTEWFPKDDDYKNFARCRILVTASRAADAVKAKITWRIPPGQSSALYSDTDMCDGDFLNVYDGNSESSRLIYSSCHQKDRPDQDVEAHVTSSRRNLFIEFDADKTFVAHSMKIEVHSLSAASNCGQPMEISVDKERKMVTSPNYPGKYPLNQECDYILRSANPRPDEDIVIKVINAKLPVHCEDILTVFIGEEMKPEDVVGRVCGKEEGKIIRVEKPVASMKFFSDEDTAHDGWSVEVYLERRDSSGGTQIRWNPLLAILVLVFTYLYSLSSL